jgi:hypothetical protein
VTVLAALVAALADFVADQRASGGTTYGAQSAAKNGITDNATGDGADTRAQLGVIGAAAQGECCGRGRSQEESASFHDPSFFAAGCRKQTF